MPTHTYTCTNQAYVHAYVYMHAYMHTYVTYCFYTCMRTWVHTYVYASRHIYMHTDTYLHTYQLHIHAYVHMYTSLGTLVKWVGDCLTDTYLMSNEPDTESMLKLEPRMMAAAVVKLLKGEGNWSLCHCFRRGGATFGCKIAPGDYTLVKWVGDWLSDTYLMYNELDVEPMLKLPRMMAAVALHTPVWASEGLLGRGLACCTFGGSLARLRTT
jgi:hypothetical protein